MSAVDLEADELIPEMWVVGVSPSNLPVLCVSELWSSMERKTFPSPPPSFAEVLRQSSLPRLDDEEEAKHEEEEEEREAVTSLLLSARSEVGGSSLD